MTRATANSIDSERPKPASAAQKAVNVNVSEEPRMVSPIGWVWITAITCLFIVFHQTVMISMIRIATNSHGDNTLEILQNVFTSSWNHDWSHVLAIPFIALAYVLGRKRMIMAERLTIFWPGLLLIFVGIAAYCLAIYPIRNDLARGLAMLMVLFGLVLFLTGPSVMKVLWFPIAYLFFFVKLPWRWMDTITWSLQNVASRGATMCLKVLGVFLGFDVENRGTTINLGFENAAGLYVDEAMNVAEACSGLRMLMAFVALAVAVAFFSNRPLWQRITITAMAVPIAVIINVARVTVIGVLYTVDKSMAQGDFHIMVGLFMLVPAYFLFIGVGWVLDRFFKPKVEGELSEDDFEPPPVHPSWRETAAHGDQSQTDKSGRLTLSIMAGLACGAAMVLLIAFAFAAGLVTAEPVTLSKIGRVFLKVESLSTTRTPAMIAFVIAIASVIALFWWARRSTQKSNWVLPRQFATALVVGVLLVSAVGFNRVVKATRVVLVKHPIALRDQFHYLPTSPPGWEMVTQEAALPPDIEDELGTREYISRVYKRTKSTPIKGDDDGSLSEIEELTVRLHLAYYTGTPDTVPHVPDRCFLAGGVEAISRDRDKTINLMLHNPDRFSNKGDEESGDDWFGLCVANKPPFDARVPEMEFKVTSFNYRPVIQKSEFGLLSGQSKAPATNVIYFFAANGKYYAHPDEVRTLAFNLRDKYAYYCKIEIGVDNIPDPEDARLVVGDFLSVMLPEIMRCLPDWVEVTEGKYPVLEDDDSEE